MNFKKFTDTMLRSFCTGISISIGGTVFLSFCDVNKLAGAFLFSFGLFVVLNFGWFLYTGKVGYIVENKPSYVGTVALIWVGNFIGAIFTAKLVLLTHFAPKLQSLVQGICSQKTDDTMASLIVLGFFCGILMFIAADGFKNFESPVMKLFAIVMPVVVFIICGFEHSVADMFYFSVAGWSPKAFLDIIVISFGNALGGIFIPLLRKAFVKD